MREIAFLRNTIQPYPWGSKTALADLLQTPNVEETPQAELWMGAHPKAPSLVQSAAGWLPLDKLVERYPVEILGYSASAQFGRRLPFLFKVLAAAEPLSIQAHPDRQLALEGYERENRSGIPVDAPQRNYRDPHHKPECILALSTFWAMCGFRPPERILTLLRSLCPRGLAAELAIFAERCHPAGLRAFFVGLLSLDPARRRTVVAEALFNAGAAQDSGSAWIGKLAEHYPEDIGVLAPAMLNVFRLDPGQALFLPAGILHSYLDGTGIEIMANSDNVVRGGLTRKPVDVAELLRILRFDSLDFREIRPDRRGSCEHVYSTPAEEFQLSAIRLRNGDVYESPAGRSVHILLCTGGRAVVRRTAADGCALEMNRGASVLAPAAAGIYRITGDAELFKASLPEVSA